MRKYLSILAAILLSAPMIAVAQDDVTDTQSVEFEIAQISEGFDSTADLLVALMSSENQALTELQKAALGALPLEAQTFFIEAILSGELASDAALTTASTQAGVTTEMGTNLFNAFSAQLADIDDEEGQGQLLETAAAGTAGPVGFGAGAGGGGGGGPLASGN